MMYPAAGAEVDGKEDRIPIHTEEPMTPVEDEFNFHGALSVKANGLTGLPASKALNPSTNFGFWHWNVVVATP